MQLLLTTSERVTVCIVILLVANEMFFIVVQSFSSLPVRHGKLPSVLGRHLFMRANDVVLPMDKLDFAYARSSGPGGQNVNKLNTKAEIRFNVPSADWLSADIRERLQLYYPNKITKDGDLVVTSQEHRTQAHNKEDCLTKLRDMISEASIEPKDRKMYDGISDKGKERRKDEKRKRSAVKESRRAKYDD
eukprot:gene11384-13236_t